MQDRVWAREDPSGGDDTTVVVNMITMVITMCRVSRWQARGEVPTQRLDCVWRIQDPGDGKP